MSGRYIRQDPYVDDNGIYTPVNEYVPEGVCIYIPVCYDKRNVY